MFVQPRRQFEIQSTNRIELPMARHYPALAVKNRKRRETVCARAIEKAFYPGVLQNDPADTKYPLLDRRIVLESRVLTAVGQQSGLRLRPNHQL